MKRTVLAIVGLPGAGKSEVTAYLQQKTGWPKIHFGQIIFDEVKRRGQELTEKNERVVREELRAKHGMGVCATLSLPRIQELLNQHEAVILESFYSWEEYLITKKEFGSDFLVLATFASPQVRVERMGKRADRPLTPEQVQSRDYSQIENLHQAGPIARADYAIINEGSLEELRKDIDKVLGNIEQQRR